MALTYALKCMTLQESIFYIPLLGGRNSALREFLQGVSKFEVNITPRDKMAMMILSLQYFVKRVASFLSQNPTWCLWKKKLLLRVHLSILCLKDLSYILTDTRDSNEVFASDQVVTKISSPPNDNEESCDFSNKQASRGYLKQALQESFYKFDKTMAWKEKSSTSNQTLT